MASNNYNNAYQDSRGYWWADTENGKIPVSDPQSSWEDGSTYYTGYDQDAMDQGITGYQAALLNGLSGDAFRWKSGTEITPQEFAQFYSHLSDPKWTQDFGGNDLNGYFNDPRAAVRYENGKFVYRPDLAQGDFKPMDYSPNSFGDMVKGFLSTPQTQIASMAFGGGGLGTLASMAGTAASVATDNPVWGQLASLIGLGTGAYNMLNPGDAVNSLGSSGIDQINSFEAPSGSFNDIWNAPTISTGTSYMDVDAPAVTSALTVPTGTPTTTPSPNPNDFSLATPGTGYGGVGTAGTGLSTSAGSTGGVIGDTANSLASQAGVSLPAISGIGAGTGAGLGLSLPESGIINSTANSLAAQGGVSLPSAGTTGSGIGSGTSVPATTTPTTNGGGGNSVWQQLGDALGFDPSTVAALSGIGSFGGSLLEWLQSSQNSKALQDMLNRASAQGDPFGSQRPFYQDMLKQSYTDPNFFSNNAVFKGLNDVAMSDAQRVAAARGYNNSSNVLYDVADRVQKTGMNYANQFQGQLGQLAGGGISPATSAQISANAANQVTQANQQTNGALGSTLANLPNLINGIKGLV